MPVSILQGGFDVTFVLVILDQIMNGSQQPTEEMLTLEHHPFLKDESIGEQALVQEIASIEFDQLAERFGTGFAGIHALVLVG